MSLSGKHKRFLTHIAFLVFFLYIIYNVIYLCNRSIVLFLSYWFVLWIYLAVMWRLEEHGVVARLVLFYHYLGLSCFLQPVFPSVPWLENLFVFLLLFFGEYVHGRYGRIVFYAMILFLYARMVFMGWAWNTNVYVITYYIIVYAMAELWGLFKYRNLYSSLLWIGLTADVREIHNIVFKWSLLGKLYVIKPYLALYSVLFDNRIVTRDKTLLTTGLSVIVISNIVDYLHPAMPPYGILLIRSTILPAIIILNNNNTL